jgi:tRNA(Leu) C34 or U34 (ribose-2'-O)-methylase TrmL
MEPAARSLNLATSVGIVLYEAKRQIALCAEAA